MTTQKLIRISATETFTRDYLLGDWHLETEKEGSVVRLKVIEESTLFNTLQLLAMYIDHFETQQAIKTFKVPSTLEVLKESEAAMASILKGNNAHFAKGKF